jgi:hypothetical protein
MASAESIHILPVQSRSDFIFQSQGIESTTIIRGLLLRRFSPTILSFKGLPSTEIFSTDIIKDKQGKEALLSPLPNSQKECDYQPRPAENRHRK